MQKVQEDGMNAHYYCRYCGYKVGSIEGEEAQEMVLGNLTNEEQLEMTHFDENGNLFVKTICESCQDTLQHNPHYYEYDTFLQ